MIAEVLSNENLGEWLAELRASKTEFSEIDRKLSEFLKLPLEDRVEFLFVMVIGITTETFNLEKKFDSVLDLIFDLATEVYGDDDEQTDELLEETH